MIITFINDICEELDIQVPKVSYDTSLFLTSTTLACCYNGTIYLREYEKPNPDQLFAIAHELRHLWQIQNNEDLYFGSYKTSNQLDIETYNLQPAEIDANAFASVIMIDWFGLQPLYNGLSNNVIAAIKKRIEEI